MIKQNRQRIKVLLNTEHITLFAITLLIFFVYIQNISTIGVFTVLDDEFGYWSIAAYFSGLDWSNAVSQIPYYSYGYSLILTPLFWFFNSSIHMYKAGIFINSILLSFSFLVCYDVAKKIMPLVNRYILMTISLLISMYPSYVVYSNIAWSECLLIFTCWLLTWCFIELDKRSSVYKFILIGCLSSYVYLIHQRSLGVLLASIFVISFMKITNQIKWKHFACVFLPIIFIAVLHYYIKHNIQSNLWLNNLGNLANDFSGQTSKLSSLFTIEGLFKALKELIGQVFYLGAASYLISYVGMFEIIKKLCLIVISSVKSRSIQVLNNSQHFYFYTFLFIALLFSMFISVVFMINPTRVDQIVYGRYTEMIIGPILLLGFARFSANEASSIKNYMLKISAFVFLAVITYWIIIKSGLNFFNPLHAVGLIFLKTQLSIFLPALVAILVYRVIVLSFNRSNRIIFITLIMITMLFFVTGSYVSKSVVVYNQSTLKIMGIVEYIGNHKEDYPIYFLWNDENSPIYEKWNNANVMDRIIVDSYQFLMKEKTITLVNDIELSNIRGSKYVISTESLVLSDLLNDYELCMSAAGSYLYVLHE